MTTPSASSRLLGSALLAPTRSPRATVLTAVVGLVVVIAAGYLLRGTHGEQGLSNAINSIAVSGIGGVAGGIYLAFEPVPSLVWGLVITGLVFWRSRSARVTASFAGLVVFTWLPAGALKAIIDRPRPALDQLPNPFSPAQLDGSYPSGHTVFITVLVLALLLLARGSARYHLYASLGAAAIAVMAMSVLIIGVHYPSDVLLSLVWVIVLAPAVRLVWGEWIVPRLPGLGR